MPEIKISAQESLELIRRTRFFCKTSGYAYIANGRRNSSSIYRECDPRAKTAKVVARY